MPYIKAERRAELAQVSNPQNAGELNYLFSCIARDYFASHGNYQGINDVVGALEGAKLEFCRRVVGQYEDKKIAENGDVY